MYHYTHYKKTKIKVFPVYGKTKPNWIIIKNSYKKCQRLFNSFSLEFFEVIFVVNIPNSYSDFQLSWLVWMTHRGSTIVQENRRTTAHRQAGITPHYLTATERVRHRVRLSWYLKEDRRNARSSLFWERERLATPYFYRRCCIDL